ncbi:MAG: MFS transporter, partial [Firmicutes bacterium]|nr:MFS transporter [Bacillota bacterium]
MFKLLWTLLVVTMGANAPAPLFPLYLTEYHLNNADLTALIVVYALGVMPTLLFSGGLADQIGKKPFVLAALLVDMGATALLIWNPGFWGIIVARILQGMSVGVFMGPGTALIADQVASYHLESALRWAGAVMMIGFGLGPLWSGLTVQYTHFMALPYILLEVLLATGFLAIFTVSETLRPASGSHRIKLGIPAGIRKSFWLGASPTGFFLFAINGTMLALIPSYVSHILHSHNLAVAGAMITLLLGGGGMAQFTAPANRPSLAIRVGSALAILGLWITLGAGHWDSFYLLLIGLALTAFGGGWIFKGGLQLAGTLAPTRQRSQVLSTFYLIAYIGMIVPVFAV